MYFELLCYIHSYCCVLTIFCLNVKFSYFILRHTGKIKLCSNLGMQGKDLICSTLMWSAGKKRTNQWPHRKIHLQEHLSGALDNIYQLLLQVRTKHQLITTFCLFRGNLKNQCRCKCWHGQHQNEADLPTQEAFNSFSKGECFRCYWNISMAPVTPGGMLLIFKAMCHNF